MAGSTNYKTQLTKAKELVAGGRETLHEVVTLAVAIMANKEFRFDIGLLDDFEVAEWIDNELFADCGLGILELQVVLQEFPYADQWSEAKSLRSLYDDVVVLQAARNKSSTTTEESARRQSTRITKAEHKEVCEERDEYKARTNYLEGRVAELEAENRELKLKIANLKGQKPAAA